LIYNNKKVLYDLLGNLSIITVKYLYHIYHFLFTFDEEMNVIFRFKSACLVSFFSLFQDVISFKMFILYSKFKN